MVDQAGFRKDECISSHNTSDTRASDPIQHSACRVTRLKPMHCSQRANNVLVPAISRRKHSKSINSVQYLIVNMILMYLFILPLFSSLFSLEQFTLSSTVAAQEGGERANSIHLENPTEDQDDDITDFDEFAEFDSMDLDHIRTDNKIPGNSKQQVVQNKNIKDKKGDNLASTDKNGFIQSSSAARKSNAQEKKASTTTEQQQSDQKLPPKVSSSASFRNEQDPVPKRKEQVSSSTVGKDNKASQSNNAHNSKYDIDDTDDDDFESMEDKNRPKGDIRLVDVPMPVRYTWDTYYIEIFFIIIISLYFVNFFIGSAKNEQFARSWYESNRNLLKQNFALVGGPPQIAPPSGDDKNRDDSNEPTKPKQQNRGLIKDTESSYLLWCSGRVGMEGLLVEINLLKRQDLVSMFMNLLKPSRDNFVLRVQLNQDSIDNFVFCLAQKSTSARLVKDMIDVNTFCPERKPASRYGINSEKLYVMNEIKEVSTFLFDQKTSQLISTYEDCIDYIHITDQFSLVRQQEDIQVAKRLSTVRKMATFSFNFPRPSQNRRNDDTSSVNNNHLDPETMVLLALTIIDRLRRFRLSRDGKQKSEKNRQKITDILQKAVFAQRQEAAQAKKDELRRQEKERIYEEDDPTKQLKWEKKEAKRELKKSRKMKQLKVKSKG